MARRSSPSPSPSESLADLRERVALQRELTQLLERQADALERIAKVSRPAPRPPTRAPTPTPSSVLSARARAQPRDASGRFLRKEYQPPPTTKPTPQVLNWKVAVRVVYDSEEERFEGYEYARYTLWVVVDFDPKTPNGKAKFEKVLKVYRQELHRQDPKVRWLSPKWQVSRTTDRPRAYLTPEPSRA